MNSLVMEPTKENIMNTFLNDYLGRNEDLALFVKMLFSLEGNCSIVLDGMWGSGKTFFVKQCKSILDSLNDMDCEYSDEEKEKIKSCFFNYASNEETKFTSYLSIYYDAWTNDNDIDPVLSIVYEIIKETDEKLYKKETDIKKLAIRILDALAKTNVEAIMDCSNNENILEEIRKQRNKTELIKDFFNQLNYEKAERIVIFIDELDRCKPDYAVKMLERIKHFFDIDNITFVFSINMMELQHTIKKVYGNDFDATRYLNRFFDIPLTLPQANLEKFYRNNNWDEYCEVHNRICNKICDYFNFPLRDKIKFFTITKFTSKKIDNRRIDESEHNLKNLYLKCIVPLMIGLRFVSVEKYNNMKKGKDSSDFVEILSDKKYFHAYHQCFLNDNESYEDFNDKTKVTISDKLKELYDLLFVQELDTYYAPKFFGKYIIDEKTKRSIIKMESLISRESDEMFKR